MNKIYDFKNKDIKIEFNSIKIGNSAYINQPIEVIEYIEYLQNQLQQKDKEIERLNNRVKQLEKSIMISNKKHSFMTKDNIKLRTIINELEKDIIKKINNIKNYYSQENGNYFNMNYVLDTYEEVLDKLQELKGEDKE